jgi:hypothetical protein
MANEQMISEHELITMLATLSPVPIIITPHIQEDGSRLYAWKAKESSGTHPELLGAVRAALEAAMVALAYTPASPESQLTLQDFPPTPGPA